LVTCSSRPPPNRGELAADPDHLVIGMCHDDQERPAESFRLGLETA
jgi:hypothetical protein